MKRYATGNQDTVVGKKSSVTLSPLQLIDVEGKTLRLGDLTLEIGP